MRIEQRLANRAQAVGRPRERAVHVDCERRPVTASMTRSWSASASDEYIGRKIERDATSSVTGKEAGPYRFR